jgi:MFS family permease
LPVLDFSVVNLTLPAVRQNLGSTSSEVQFVISAYAATYAVVMITGGRLGDLLGRRRLFMLGAAGFTLASVLCGIAWSPPVLIADRILQGLTAGDGPVLRSVGRPCFFNKSLKASSASSWKSIMRSRASKSSACHVSSSNWTRLPRIYPRHFRLAKGFELSAVA